MAYTSSGSSSSSSSYSEFKTGEGFDSQVFDNQVNDKYKTFERYHAVPPPYTGNFMPPKPNLILADVDEYVLSESVTSVPAVVTSEAKTSETKPKTSKSVSEDISNEVKESLDSPLVKELVSDDKGNQRNWNNQKSQQLGSDFVMYNKACFVYGSFDHVQADCNYHQRERVRTCPISLTSRNLMEDMLPLGDEPKEEKLLVKELLKLVYKKVLVQNASNDKPQPYSDDGKKDDASVSKESVIDNQEKAKTDREKKTQSTAIPNEPIPQENGSGGSPRRQDTILGDRPAQTRFERLSKQSYEPPLLRVNTLGSGEDNMQLMELMELCIKLFVRVFALENNKIAQDLEITHLKKRVKKLKRRNKSRTLQPKGRVYKPRVESSIKKSLGDQEDASNQERNDRDEGISFVQKDAKIQGRYGHDIKINTASTTITTSSINITTTEPVTTVSTPITTVGVSVITTEPNHELAERLQTKEQGELSIEERSKLFVELINQRKKNFARLRAEEKRRKPPTKAQKWNQMCTYLKNMAGFSHNPLKNKSFKEVQKAFYTTMSWINSFVHMDKEVLEGSGKKAKSSRKEAVSKKSARKGLDEESIKRQKLEDDAQKEELRDCLEIV
nr:retrotransposon Orf1 [Tanacetum cinerariifolium]